MNKKKFLFLFLLFLSFCIITNKGPSKDTPPSKEQKYPHFSWGKTQQAVRLGAASIKQVQILGKEARIIYKLENNGKKSIRCYFQPAVQQVSRPLWSRGYIRVVIKDSEPVVCTKTVPYVDTFADIEPGNSLEHEINLAQYFNFTSPGLYKVTLTLKVYPTENSAGNRPFGISSGEFPLILEEDNTREPWKYCEGEFVLDRDIPVNLEWGTDKNPDLLKVKSVRFKEKKYFGGAFILLQPHAYLTIEILSYPKTTWVISVTLLDGSGQQIGWGRTNFSNSGMIISFPVWSNHKKDIPLSINQSTSLVKKFRISVKDTPEKYPQPNHCFLYKNADQEVKSPPSEKGRSWGPEQATGAPDTNEAGDIKTAWASLTPDNQDEWLLLEYETSVIPSRIDIYETYNPGAVNRVTVFDQDGEEVEVWIGEDPTPPGSGKGVSQIPVDIDFKTKKIKIYLDSKNVPGWNEIDAVGLVDQKGNIQWAKKAKASSTYAEPN